MVDLEEGTDRAALAAARAEGRTEGAEKIRALVARWMVELTKIAEREFTSDAARHVVEQFTSALEQTLEQNVETLRLDQARTISRYCEVHRAKSSAQAFGVTS